MRTADMHSFVARSFFDIDEDSLDILESYPSLKYINKSITNRISHYNLLYIL